MKEKVNKEIQKVNKRIYKKEMLINETKNKNINCNCNFSNYNNINMCRDNFFKE